ncbi:6-carboxytetrahydropterin synthase QueD [Corticicoccus populi]|uniref:6-carboxy-5,6,7,8-tetrahydropterin synthase n=1 Tax=Corticicoccus populi TaxID=1812821 RepID=A0ABW5WVN7_9STAP
MFYQTPEHNYQYELNKDLNFSAAHHIPDERAGKCSRIHGHTYHVNITVAGDTLDELGFLVNFSALKGLIMDAFDHRLINDHEAFKDIPPTSETLSKVIYDMVDHFIQTEQPNDLRCLQIILRETPTSYVVYRPKEYR